MLRLEIVLEVMERQQQQSLSDKKLIIIVSAFFIVQILTVVTISISGAVFFIRNHASDASVDYGNINNSDSEEYDENIRVLSAPAAAATPAAEEETIPSNILIWRKLLHIDATLTRQEQILNETMNRTETLFQKILKMLECYFSSDGIGCNDNDERKRKDNDDDDNSPDNVPENKLQFTRKEVRNFQHILGRAKYQIVPNVPVRANRGIHRYKHIITFPYNFQLHVFLTEPDHKFQSYLQHVAGAFQAFFMIHADTYSPDYLRRVLSNVVKYAYRYPDNLYPGASSSSGYYQPNGDIYYVRQRYGYQVDAHEFVHMLDFHLSPQRYRREGEQYVDGLANLLSGVCSKRLTSYRTLIDLVRGVGENKRYDYGPALVAFFLSNQPLRAFHAQFTQERSKERKNYSGLERHFLHRFSSDYHPEKDYCALFFDTLKHYSDFWSDDFIYDINTNLEVINDYIGQ